MFSENAVLKKLNLLPVEAFERAAACLKVMAHPVRLQMVEMLMQGDFSVQELAEMVDLPHHQTCEHLRLLKGHGLLDSERRGRMVFYQIADPRLPGLIDCIKKHCH